MISNNITIFLGDINSYLGMLAKKHDPSAWLLDHNSLTKFAESREKSKDVTVYTSLGDLPKDILHVMNILQQADIIVYCPPTQWSDKKTLDILDPTASIHGLTETLLMMLPSSVQIRSFKPFSPDDLDPNPLVDVRKTQDPQLWIAGCSVSHGVGVDADQRYGALLAEELGLECSFLTRGGSAIDWSADQILRSDIRAGDIVVWGLTNWNRITYIHNHKLLKGVVINTYDDYPEYHNIVSMENLFLDQTFYQHFYSIKQVINYCNKIGSKLFLAPMVNGNYSLLSFLYQEKNYIHIPHQLQYKNNTLYEKYEDLGSDHLHPGPKQHLIYKNIILNFINQNK